MKFARLWVLIRREALATLRDPFTVSILIAVPLVALFLFSSILSTSVHDLPMGVLDFDRSPTSRRLVAQLEATRSFLPIALATRQQLDQALSDGRLSLALVLPDGLDRDVGKGRPPPGAAARRPQVQVIYDGAETVLAGNAEAFLGATLAATALQDAGVAAAIDQASAGGATSMQRPPVRVLMHALFNPTLDGQPFMIAGTFGFVLSFATTLIIAVSVVNERFSGTFEQLQVTPATTLEIVLGKVLPLSAVFSLDVVLMMLAAGFVWGVWPAGSVIFFLLVSTFYQVISLSLGLIVSATSATAQEAVAKTVLLATPLIQLSGFALPIQNMAWPFRWIAELIPATHYIRVSRGIYLRGEGPLDLIGELSVILLMGLVLGGLALRAVGRRE